MVILEVHIDERQLMSMGNDANDDLLPEADVQEQQRVEQEDTLDPEVPVREGAPFDESEADPADVADQQREVPLDDERRDD